MRHLQPGAAEGADAFEQETGINIQTDVDTWSLASATGDGETKEPPLVLARGRFDADEPRIGGARNRRRGRGIQGQTADCERRVQHGGRRSSSRILLAVGTPAALRRAIDTKESRKQRHRQRRDHAAGQGCRRRQRVGRGAVRRADRRAQLPAELAKQLPRHQLVLRQRSCQRRHPGVDPRRGPRRGSRHRPARGHPAASCRLPGSRPGSAPNSPI